MSSSKTEKVQQELTSSTPTSKLSLRGNSPVLPENVEEEEFPEGGARAWLVVLGSAVALFATFGYANAVGVFLEYYGSHQLVNESPSSIAWIGSLQVFILLGSGLFSGPLFDQHGEKVIYPPIVLYIFSVMMTSISTKLWHFILAQGLLGGLTMGMMLGPCMAATGQYFKKKRAAAMGLTIGGSSIGGVVFPIMLSKLFANPNLSFGWTVRICGFMMVPLLAITAYTVKARLPSRKGTFFLPEAFKSPPYVALIVSMFCATLGIFVPMFYIPTYAVQHGMSVQLASYLASIFNGASFFGRAIPGLLADKIGGFNMLTATTLCSGIMIFCWTRAVTNSPIVVFAAMYGFFSGGLVSLMSFSFMSVTNDPKKFGTYYGMAMSITSVAALIGPPITGALVNRYGRFDEAAWFSGVAVLVGGVGVILTKSLTGKGMLSRT
ncbi:monocarboxylate permease-like protein [Amylocarpus encephaloides]|uniref:Monocarboxylate permease-like protein n=1 Tax=Amylocarpus encephaloides TaxID=45428 RepID=A0A9P8C4V9_9HELO|nr:monocarboxylate permease-like protein [Amylocarpus encephaloides]